jgi:hypothetical protein
VSRAACILAVLLCWPSTAALGQAQTADDKPASPAAEPAAGRGKQSRAQQRRAQRAQRKRGKPPRPRAGRGAASESKQAAAEAATPAAQAPATPASDAAASAPAASTPARGAQPPAAPAAAAGDDVRVEGDTQVKVMEFSGLDIEGQLKTPQMLYFLNRMRAEFGRPRLPHRSFMPELQRGTRSKAF